MHIFRVRKSRYKELQVMGQGVNPNMLFITDLHLSHLLGGKKGRNLNKLKSSHLLNVYNNLRYPEVYFFFYKISINFRSSKSKRGRSSICSQPKMWQAKVTSLKFNSGPSCVCRDPDWEPLSLPPKVHSRRKLELKVDLGFEPRYSNTGCRCPKQHLNCCTKCPLDLLCCLKSR